MLRLNQSQVVIFSLSVAATIGVLYYFYKWKAEATKALSSSKGDDLEPCSPMPRKAASDELEDKTPLVRNTRPDEKTIHAKIEDLDKKGKSLFKDKKFLEAAQVFTEALDLIDVRAERGSSSLSRQAITLMNNRSAMYEKAGMPELALEDCVEILDRDVNHTKARTRKLRLLEMLKRWNDALVEVCAIQLLYMKANRENLRMGLPVPPPPVPQSKMEELLNELLPAEVDHYASALNANSRRSLPSQYTISQLLRSYTGYNAWMAAAAKDGSVSKLTSELPEVTDVVSTAKRAEILMRRGRRHVYDRDYVKATDDFEEGYKLVENNEEAQLLMEGDSYARLLEWTGMVRHWHYNLDSAMKCYQKSADVEPTNANILVKEAGVQMDAGKHDEAARLFDMALGMDPTAADALLHRANLRMLQGRHEEAKRDLELCLELRPNHVMARLRLASILAAMNDPNGAKQELEKAEQEEPSSSEVASYRGELQFTQGQMDEARRLFERAIQLEPSNPTPYVNAAMAVLNTPVAPGQIPDVARVMELLEKAIDVDPQFTAAYMQLGQLALGSATDLSAARQVITLYDRGLENCRSPEEIKELCGMRILTVAQVDAATMLKMETFNMQ